MNTKKPTVTNIQSRPIVNWYQLTKREQALTDDLISDEDHGFPCFFHYANGLYLMEDVMNPPFEIDFEGFEDWDGYMAHSCIDGIVVRLTDDSNEIVVGKYTR